MAYAHTNFPALAQKHVDQTRFFATRSDMVSALGKLNGVVAELGVAAGEFSQFMMDTLVPKKFVAIDLFDMHKNPIIWGRPSTELFNNMTQLDFFKDRFAKYGSRVTTDAGLSYEVLEKYEDKTFDLIYIDAGHDYESVTRDAEVSARKLKADGLIVFNDYVLYDPFGEGPYGVVQAVNEMVVAGSWRVVGFALQHSMFCDIAVKRI